MNLALIAVVSTLLLGLLLGSLIFIFSMWTLRQRNDSEDNSSEEGGNSPLACTSTFRPRPVTNVEMNAAYGYTLDGSTTTLLPPSLQQRPDLTENEMTYEAITDIYPSGTTDANPPVYVEESEIHAPTLNSVASTSRTCESGDGDTNQYLEILASSSTHLTSIPEVTDSDDTTSLDHSAKESPTECPNETEDSGVDDENSMQ